jgi:NDP-sugar pyrophosphorylase family protein
MKGQMSMAGEANFKRILETVSTQGFKDVLIVGSDATSVAAAEVDAENMELNAKTLIIEGVEAAAPEVALGHIESALRDETFVYWDTRFGGTVNLADLLDFHKASKAVATIAVAQSSGSGAGAGLVGQLYGSKVVKMGTVESAGGGLSVTGVMVFEPTVFTSLSKGKQLYKEVLPRLSQEGKLHGFAFMPQQERVTAQTR